MFKKTLLAAAIATVASAPAFAELAITPNGNAFSTTKVANVTKIDSLSLLSATQDVTLSFTSEGDIKNNGNLLFTLEGDASFNASEVRQWLTSVNDGTNELFPGITLNGGNYADGTTPIDDADLADQVKHLFKTETDGAGRVTLVHAIDMDGKRLRLQYASDVEDNLDYNTPGAANDLAPVIKFNLSNANQAFNVEDGAKGGVNLAIRSALNGSTTAETKKTEPLFDLVPLFKLSQVQLQDDETADATALISEGYNNWDLAEFATDNGAMRTVTITNNTSKQAIIPEQIKLTLSGDFEGYERNETTGKLTGFANWDAVEGGISTTLDKVADVEKLIGEDETEDSGNKQLKAEDIELPLFALDGDKAISGGQYNLKVEMVGGETFKPYPDVVTDFFLVERDGMKFDTILTGSTSKNTIHIRDVAKKDEQLEEPGKIFVTVIEYDNNSVDANRNAEGKVLVERKELTGTPLPPGGAVTLDPETVAQEVGADIQGSREARFIFEVETKVGEVAVKKQTDQGTDIQTGSQAAESGLVDFTL